MGTNDFEALINDSSYDVRLARIPLVGHLEDIGPYNRAWSPLTYSEWQKTPKGHGLNFGFSVAHGAELEAGDATYCFFTDSFEHRQHEEVGATLYHRLFCKRDAVDTQFEIRLHISVGTYRIEMYDSASVESIDVDVTGRKSIIITHVNGQIPAVYLDGALFGFLSGVQTITTHIADTVIGIYYTGTQLETAIQTPCLGACIFGKQLSDSQVSDLHDSFESLIVGRSGRERKVFAVPSDPSVFDVRMLLDGEIKDGKAVDKSSYGNSPQVYPGVAVEPGPGMQALVGDNGRSGTCRLTITDPSLQSCQPFTYSFWMKPDSAGQGGYGRIFDLSSSARSYISPRFWFRDVFSVSGGTWWRWNDTKLHRWQHIIVSFSRLEGETPLLWVNGEPTAWSISSGGAVGVFSPGNVLQILNTGGLVRAFDGKLAMFRFGQGLLDDAEARRLYAQDALQLDELLPKHSFPVTLFDVLVGDTIGNFECTRGQHSFTYDSAIDSFVITTHTVGELAIHDKYEYGAYVFDANLSASSDIQILFIATVPYAANDPGQDGFELNISSTGIARIRRRASGAVANTVCTTDAGTIASGTWYRFAVLRDTVYDTFRLYAKGGAYSDYTLLCSGVDTTVVPGRYFVISNGADQRIANIRRYPYWYALSPALAPNGAF